MSGGTTALVPSFGRLELPALMVLRVGSTLVIPGGAFKSTPRKYIPSPEALICLVWGVYQAALFS